MNYGTLFIRRYHQVARERRTHNRWVTGPPCSPMWKLLRSRLRPFQGTARVAATVHARGRYTAFSATTFLDPAHSIPRSREYGRYSRAKTADPTTFGVGRPRYLRSNLPALQDSTKLAHTLGRT